jgi:hypothetical protein
MTDSYYAFEMGQKAAVEIVPLSVDLVQLLLWGLIAVVALLAWDIAKEDQKKGGG